MKQSRTLSQLGRFLVFFLLVGAFAPAAAQQATDSWAPPGSQAPIRLRVIDPINGLIDFPPVHATLLPDGRVMLIAKTGIHARAAYFTPGALGDPLPPGSSVLLTPETVPVNINTPIDYVDAMGRPVHIEETLFCSGHALMADGSIFVAGGTLLLSVFDPPTQTTVNWVYGMPNTTLYSYPLRSWFRLQPDMIGTGATGSNRRWYGTVTRLADERMLITSGYELADIQVRVPGQQVQHHGSTQNRSVEVWTPAAPPAASSRNLVSTHLQTPEAVWNPDYTHVFQFPYPDFGPNLLLMFGDNGLPVYLDPDLPPGTGWFPLSGMPRPGVAPGQAPNHGAASVLLPLRASNGEWGYVNGSVLQAGGGRGSTMEHSIDFFDPVNFWGQGIDVGLRRRYPATVLLPDGKVMVVSGYDGNATNVNPLLRNAHYLDLRPPVLPSTVFTTGTASGEVRGYHNVALLLPDGRVLIAGGRSAGETDDEDEKATFRYLYPPYMSPRGSPPPRPAITAAPQTIGYNSSFTLEVSGGPVGEVVLMGLGSMTHAFDMDQRYVQLAATPQGDSAAQVTGPANAQTAPPGHYMLFVLNGSRVPSIARFVRVMP
jgi:hypothetical protein